MKNLLLTLWEDYLFGNPYGPYELYSTNTERVPIKKEVVRPGIICPSDSMDFMMVDTGEFHTVEVQVWVAYHKRTKLPTYWTTRVSQN